MATRILMECKIVNNCEKRRARVTPVKFGDSPPSGLGIVQSNCWLVTDEGLGPFVPNYFQIKPVVFDKITLKCFSFSWHGNQNSVLKVNF